MVLHPDFPSSPDAILKPQVCWLPADEVLPESSMEYWIEQAKGLAGRIDGE